MAFTAAHFLRMTPVVFSWVALLLAVLVLCAGNKPGFMEGYNLISVDILSSNSPSSKQVLDTRSPSPSNDCGGSLSWLCDQMNSAASTAFQMTPTPPPVPAPAPTPTAGSQDTPTESSTPYVADFSGRFYSFYTMTLCEGVITLDGDHNMDQCHPYFTGDPATIPYLLSVANLSPHDRAPLRSRSSCPDADPDPTDITPPYAILSSLEQLTTLAQVITILWSVGLGFTGLALFASIPAVLVSHDDGDDGIPATYQWAVYTNIFCSICAFGFLILGALVGAIGAKVKEGTIRGLAGMYRDADASRQAQVENSGMEVLKKGSGFGGIDAMAGTSWVGMSWGTVALMLVVVVYWVVRMVKLRRAKREERDAENSSSVEEVLRPDFPGYTNFSRPRGPPPQGPPPQAPPARGPPGAGFSMPNMPNIPGAPWFFKTAMNQMGRGGPQQ
ncbi:hypothetical protein B0J18DRAFT_241936 [Chaetomium sp. MPI-SDFR-AT-0129]|nr:hypothetical protein B0J18DRAFT_241936 [Chaetomium sp. MPI-SDFR-AT-0129]